MDWALPLVLMLGGFLVLMFSGMPVAFAFLLVNIVGVWFFLGGGLGLHQMVLSLYSSVTNFSLVAIALFVLMGDIMFYSALAPLMIDAVDKWMGRLPGRLGLLAVAAGTLFATLSGSSAASTALLGDVLVPEMEKRGYRKAMTLGPILGSSGLAVMIPPSAMAILLGFIGQIPIAELLVAIIVPGLLMAAFYATYILVRCKLQPSLAPAYTVMRAPLSEKLVATVKYVLPLGLIVFLVTGIIFLGIATPSEAAATGTLGAVVLAAVHRRLNWGLIRKSFAASATVTVMVLVIVAAVNVFSQVLSFSGTARGLAELIYGLDTEPIVIVIAMQLVMLVMGMFMGQYAIMMITLPIFVPIISRLGFDLVWFGAIVLLNMEIALTSPPYGLCLFVMKAVAPPDTTMGDIYAAALPFIGCDLVVMGLMIAFPAIVLQLPGLML